MSMKIVLVAAASVMAVTPALAMSKSEIVHHTGGPIPYSQLVSMDKSGYNARSHHKHARSNAAGSAVAANSSTDTSAAGQVSTPAPAPAAPETNAATPAAPGATTSTLPPAAAPAPSSPSATTPPAGAPQ